MSTIGRLIGFILTGFPLAQQRASLVELLKTMAISEGDIVRLATELQGESKQEITNTLTDFAKSKNKAIKEAHEFLN